MEELSVQETAGSPRAQFPSLETQPEGLSPEPEFLQDTDMEQGLPGGKAERALTSRSTGVWGASGPGVREGGQELQPEDGPLEGGLGGRGTGAPLLRTARLPLTGRMVVPHSAPAAFCLYHLCFIPFATSTTVSRMCCFCGISQSSLGFRFLLGSGLSLPPLPFT